MHGEKNIVLAFYKLLNRFITKMQDILMNDEVKLDNTFKLSLMTDVAKGMEYLHKSHLHSHGNLKSSNCLVDGRWTVRVRLITPSSTTICYKDDLLCG